MIFEYSQYNLIINLDSPFTLYRSDPGEDDSKIPSDKWSTEYKNPDCKVLPDGAKDRVTKNPAGLFFLTDSIDIAKAYSKRHNKFYLSQTETKEKIRVLDFSSCVNVFQMLCILNDININILTDKYYCWEGGNLKATTFKDKFETTFNTLIQLNYIDESVEEIYNIFEKFNSICPENDRLENVGFYGQMLTDNDNGFLFKDALLKLNIHGYRWREWGDMRGFTYCLHDYNMLSDPQKTLIKNS